MTAAVRLLFPDAAFAKTEIYDYLPRNIGYAIRLPNQMSAAGDSAPANTAYGVAFEAHRSYHDFVYQAQSWNVARRVVSKVEWHQGELFPRVGFIVPISYPNIGIVQQWPR